MHKGLEKRTFCSYEEASIILDKYANGAPWTKHCFAVSSLAMYLSNIFATKYPLNIEFVRTASLLHDIGRFKTHDPILHGVEGYKLLVELGHADEAFICASHILYGLNRSEAAQYGLPRNDFIPISFEERLIPLVDFLVEHDRPVLLRERFKHLGHRNRNNNEFLLRLEKAEQKAEALMNQLNDEFNISIEALSFSFFSAKISL
jgi:putative nucleotidyltransferase with HDIG domain